MNRKIGVVILALVAVLCLSFGACKLGTGSAMTKEEALQSYIFENNDQIVKEDFVLPKRIGDYRATWTSDSEYVVLEKGEDNYIAKVTIPEEDAVATLTVDLRGATKTYTVRLAAITTYDIIESYSFPQNKATVYEDFELATEATFKGKTATITWAVEDEASKKNISVDGNVCKVLPSSLNPTVKINATFTYKDKAVPTFYTFTVSEKMEHLQEVNYWYTNTGVSINMKGYVVAIGTVWSSKYNNVTLYMMDENFDAGYYLYRVGCDAANAANLKPGAYVTVEGTTNTLYNGLYETNAGGTLKVDTTKPAIDVSQYVYAIDNDILADAPAANYNQSRLVSLTNWKVSEVKDVPEEGSNATLFTLEKGGKKVAVSVSKYYEGVYAANKTDPAYKGLIDKQAEIKQKLDAGEEVVVSVKGILGNYKGAQIMPYSAADIVIGGTVGENDTVIANTVAKAMKVVNTQFGELPSIITSNTTLELAPTIEGVEVSYKLLGVRNSFGIADGKLAIIPDAAEVATVQATFTYQGYTANTFYVMRAENLDDQGKAKWEIENLKVMTEVLASGEYDLPTTSFFDNATITWTTDAPYATVNGTKVNVSLPLEASRMVLTATVKVGEATATRDYYVAVSAMNPNVPVYAESIAPGTYKMALYQGNIGKTLYLDGKIEKDFLTTTTDPDKAADVTVEAGEQEGYTLKVSGKYIEVYKTADAKIRATLVDAPTASWTLSEKGVLVFNFENEDYFLNAYSSYETFGVSKISYYVADESNGTYAAKFVTGVRTMTAQDILDNIVNLMPKTVSEDFALDFKATWEVLEGSQGIAIDGNTAKVTQAEAEQTATLKATLTYNGETVTKEITVTVAAIPPQNPAPIEGSYVFGLYQKTLGKWLYAKAENSSNGRYLVTTENPVEAAEAVLTAKDGGYTIQLNGKYVEVGNNADGKTSALLLDTPTSVWTWNEEAGVMTFEFNSKVWYLGTYNNFNTISASETKYVTGTNVGNIGETQFICKFVRPAPAEGEYVYGLYQASLNQKLYATDTIKSDRYLATTTEVASASKFTVAKSGEGYTITVNGKYVEVGNNAAGKASVLLLDAPTGVWTWNDEAGVMSFEFNSKIWYLGTYGTFNTVSASETWRITGEKAGDLGTSQFVCKFEVASQTSTCEHTWNEGEITTEATCTAKGVKTYTCTLCQETKTEEIPMIDHVDANNDNACDVCGAAMTVVAKPAPEEGEYHLYMDQVNKGQTLYLTGEMSGYYFATSEDEAQAATVTLTKDGNGYVMMVNGKYIEILLQNGHKNVLFQDTKSGVWTWNEEAGVMTFDVEGEAYYLGTYGTYTTFSGSAVSRITGDNVGTIGVSQFIAQFKAISGGTHTHAWGEGVVTTEATCTQEGVKTFTCECGETKTEPIAMIDHADNDGDNLCDVCGTAMGTPTPDYETKTLAEFLALADSNEAFYQIEGVVTGYYQNQANAVKYGNVYITDGETTLLVYGLCAEKMALSNGKFTNDQSFSGLNVEIGSRIVILSAKGSYNGEGQAVGSGLLEIKTTTDLDKIMVAKLNLEVPASVNADFVLPTYEGVQIEWTSNNTAAIAISGTQATVTQTASVQEVTITAKITCNTATENVEYKVSVAAKVEGAQTITYDFLTNVTGWSTWGSSYGPQSLEVNGTKIDFSRANKQGSGMTIDDRPVLATNASSSANAADVYVTVDMGSVAINSVTFNLKQWGTKTFKSITVEYFDGTSWQNCATLGSLSGECSVTGNFASATQVRLHVNNTTTKNNQLGITSIVVTTAA